MIPNDRPGTDTRRPRGARSFSDASVAAPAAWSLWPNPLVAAIAAAVAALLLAGMWAVSHVREDSHRGAPRRARVFASRKADDGPLPGLWACVSVCALSAIAIAAVFRLT